MNSKVKNYKRALYLLDSIAGLAEKHINDIVSYKYEYTKCTKLPVDTLYEGLAVTIKSITSNCTIYFYTDATPTRQIIQSPTNAKDNILDPLKYPDYYRRIERAGLDYEPQ